nr:hypothetical protein [Tanacetum cinerariifolium]
MAEFLRFPNFRGCKVAAGTLLPPGIVGVTHLTPSADRQEDIPARTGDMVVAEMLEKKVLAEKEKKKRTKRKAETDEQSPPRHESVDEHMVNGDAENKHGDENIANEGHSDNTAGLSGLRMQSSPTIQPGLFYLLFTFR